MQYKPILGALVIVGIFVCGFVVWKQQTNTVQSTAPVLHDGYIIKSNKVYYVSLSPRRSDFEMKDADASTFTPLGSGWGKDSTHVYYSGYTTRPADATVPTIHTSTFTSLPDTFYAKDDQAVYFPNFIYNSDYSGIYVYNVFPGADPNTFEIVKSLMYAKDKTHVWNIRQGEGGPAREEIKGVNPANCTADNLKGCEAR